MVRLVHTRDALRVAREAMESAVRGAEYRLPPRLPNELLRHRAGVFVTLVQGGKLRACWGTLEPQHPHLAAEIAAAARGVCSRDTRFPPLRADEVRSVRIILTVVLSPAQPAKAWQIRPREHGVLVRWKDRSAVVLPHEGRTVRRMLTLARQKAGIPEGEPVEIYTFRVQTVQE